MQRSFQTGSNFLLASHNSALMFQEILFVAKMGKNWQDFEKGTTCVPTSGVAVFLIF